MLEKLRQMNRKLIGMIVLAIVIIVGIGICNTPINRLNRQLNLGQRYLEAHNYEQAIVEFDKAISIDPMSVDAYLGKAQAYVSMGAEEKAIEVLQTGYEITGDARLRGYIDKLSTGREAKTHVSVETDHDNAERIEELEQVLIDGWEEYSRVQSACRSYINPDYDWGGQYLSSGQIEELCRPFVNGIEEYIELTGDVGVQRYGGGYGDYGYDLALFYYALGEKDKCLEIRKKLYELTGDFVFTPAEHTDENSIITYDQYGNIIVNSNTNEVYKYGDNGRLSKCDSTRVDLNGNEDTATYTYIYGNDGRLIEIQFERMFGDGNWMKTDETYQYNGNKVIVYYHEEEDDGFARDICSEYEMDKYGTLELQKQTTTLE